jgi:hypothetical protein
VEFSVSENGVLAYMTKQSITRMVWYDRSGREVGELGEAGEHDSGGNGIAVFDLEADGD